MDKDSINLLIDQDRWFRQLWEQLKAPFPPGTIQNKERGGGAYIPVQAYIQRLNQVCGPHWSFYIRNQVIHEREQLVQVNGILRIGSISEHEGMGFSHFQRYADHKEGKIMNLKSGLRSAASDALRDCCDQLEMGWSDLGKNTSKGEGKEKATQSSTCIVCREPLSTTDMEFIQEFNRNHVNREITKPYCRQHIPTHFLRKS